MYNVHNNTHSCRLTGFSTNMQPNIHLIYTQYKHKIYTIFTQNTHNIQNDTLYCLTGFSANMEPNTYIIYK